MRTDDFTIVQALDSYLRITENWIHRQLKHLPATKTIIVTDRVLGSGFDLPAATTIRSPLQPRLWEGQRITRWLRLRRLLCRITYIRYASWRLRHTQVDLVHSHFAQVGWRFHKLAKRLGVAHMISFYGWDYVRLANSGSRWKQRLATLFAEADAFVCEGPHGRQLLIQQGCPPEKVYVSRLGVETDRIAFIERRKPRGTLRLLQIASFREKKGQIDAVAAFATALGNCTDMHLTLIGDAPGRVHDVVAALIAEHGISDKVSLLPGVPFDELHEAMRDHHVFIHPSRHAADGDCEGGAPVVLLDAQATGMPIIATTHCDIPEEVLDGVTGLLCPERDVAALTRCIHRFHEMDTTEYNAYASAARLHVEQHFEARMCAADLEQIYAKVIAARNTGEASCIR